MSAALAAAIVAVLAAAGRRPARRSIVLVAAAALALGWTCGLWRLRDLDADPLAPRVGHALVGGRVLVEEAWHGGGRQRVALGRILGSDGGRVLLRLPGADGPARGAVLRADGSLERPRAGDGGFDERDWLGRQGVHAVLRLRDWRVVGRRGGAWGAADRAREAALAPFAAATGGDAGAVAEGLAFGGTATMGRETVDAFRASGLAHLLAVSGGNVALLLALVVALTWTFGGTRRHGLALGVGAVIAYTAVVGPSPSVVRAGVAGVVGCLAWLLGRTRDAWRAAGLAFGLLLAWNPRSVWDVGLQLSFAAVAAILLVVPRARAWAAGTTVPEAVVVAAAVTIAATLATAPIAWWHFGRAALLAAVPANLLAAPAVAPAVWLALLAALAAPVAPAAGAGLAWLAQWPAAWILRCAWLGADLAAAAPAWLAPLAGAAAAAGVAVRRRR